MEVNLEQPKKKKQRLNDAPVAVYRIIEVPPDIEGVAKTATIQIVPKVDEDEEISNQSVAGDKVNVTVTTSFVIGEDSSVKQHSTSQVIRLPVSLRGRRRKIADGSDTDGSFVDSSDKIFPCFICTKSFKHSSHLKRHVNTHTGERIYKCDLCEKTFLDASTLSRHRKIHSGDKPWSCKICKKSFGTLGSLRRHITVHNQEGRPYQCETCLKRFPDNSSYQKHKFIHTGIKPHVCDICGKAFVHIGDLNGHRKIHVEVKPYNCERCGKDFAKHSNYARHLLIHEGEKYFTCSICGVSYNFQSSLTRHILTHVRRGNKMAIEDLAETNSKIAITEDHAIADSVEKDDLNESESSYEKSKKSVILKVTRTKMKDLSKIKHLQELKKALTAKSLPCETEDDAKKLEIPPGMPECDPDDPTILPPQDETISKETTTEDAFSILTAAEDFGSTKDIPVPLLPPPLPISFDATCSTEENLLFAPSSGESEYILSGEEPGELTNDSSDANKEEPDKIITIISLARDEGTSNEQNSAAGSSNANVFVTMVNDGTDNNIEDSIVVGGDNNSIVETIVPDSLNSSEQDGSTSKSCNLDTIYSEVPAKLNPEEILLLKKAAKMVLSSKSEF